jgi:CubicO group peptidase (beta-lactamase class C family)
MIKSTCLLFITTVSIQFCFSQSIDTLKLNEYFKQLDVNNKFMGSVALLNVNKIAYSNQIGYADVETQKKPNADTKYRIGSISKTFTATLIFKALEEEKLDLNQTINYYFPSIKRSSSITIGNLLNHRSGIHNFTDDKHYFNYNTKPKTKAEMLAIISTSGSDFEPNSKSKYSNSNYLLLSYILEEIYNKNFAEILNEKILHPINLKNTFYGSKIDLSNNEAYSYLYNEQWKKQAETDMSIPLGAGGIISTPTDLLQFSQALFSYKIISKNSLDAMKLLKDNYGMGIFKIPFHDKFSFGHYGSIDGFNAVFVYFPKEKCAAALTSNGNNYDINSILNVLSSSLFNLTFQIPTFTTYQLKSGDLDKYLGIYSSPTFPLKISITKLENTLYAQATGQSAFNLKPTEKDKFEFDKAGIVIEFDTANNQMDLKQGGKTFKLTKE